MTEHPDLQLPERVLEMEQYHDTPMKVLPFAFYSLAKNSQTEMEAYRQLCATDLDDDQIRLPPRWDFHGESLRTIVKSHVELGQQGEFDPTYFVVSVNADCSTVILVTLDDDDMECKPDLLWTPMNQSGLLCNSLQIGNLDWSEAKEDDLGGPQWSQPGPGDPSTREGDGQDYGPSPPVGFHIQLYYIDGVDSARLLYKIQPGPPCQKQDPSQHSCKLQNLPVAGGQDPAREAANLHPARCLKHPTLQKNYFIVADSLDFMRDGVQIVYSDWDGKVDGRTSEELLDIGCNAKFMTQRAEVLQNVKRAAVGLVLMLAQGYEKWAVEHKLFAVYAGSYPDSDIRISQAVDSRWSKRGHGQDRVAFGGSLTASRQADPPTFWRSLLERHVEWCKLRRFVPNAVRQYLIWCGEQPATPSSEVLLVKLDWDGEMRSTESLLDNATSRVSVWRATAKDAHGLLTDVAEGKKVWSGERL